MSTITRFNLLLLEEGEIFFEDYAAMLYLPSNGGSMSTRKQLSGRLKVASKNLIFEPHSINHAIYRFPLQATKSLVMDKTKQHLIVITSQMVKLKAHNVVGPYQFVDIAPPIDRNGHFIFEPSFSRLDDFVGLVAKIYQITKDNKHSKSSKQEQILKLMLLRESKIPFDSSWFVDINESEKLSKPLIVSKLEPLIEIRGQLQITNKRIYFQPFHNLASTPMLKYHLKEIKYIFKRRHIMLPRALEIIFVNDEESLLVSFANEIIRDNVYKLLLLQSECSNVKHSLSLRFVQQKWIAGQLSNYDYLMFLNQQSGRSFNDLTQYPIFPWIVTDYESDTIDLDNVNIYRDLSKPVGALNPSRLAKILKRYNEMPADSRFMYGSHYSTPGYVMYFLVRQSPELMLRFQNGKFDAPDRLFSSIARTWDSAYNSLTDVKELIPQFYDTQHPQNHHFLLNTKNLNLGVRSDKRDVHNVQLPKWANHDPKYFIQTLRKALESEYVSSHLHEWIDLIWGHKQTGIAAEKAYNKFYYLTYEGAVDIRSIQDPAELNSIRMQINEFGQTPSQLFKQPHPPKFSHSASNNHMHATPPMTMDNVYCGFAPHHEHKEEHEHEHEQPQLPQQPNDADQDDGGNVATAPDWKPLHDALIGTDGKASHQHNYEYSTISPHAHRITDLCISSDEEFLFSTSHDSTLSVYSFREKRILRSLRISHLALSSCCTPSNFQAFPFCMIGSWDNNVYVFNAKQNKVEQVLKSHNDAISCLAPTDNGLSSGSWDSTIKIWQYRGNQGMESKPVLSYRIDCEVRCMANCFVQPSILVNGDENGNIYMFDTRSNSKKYMRLWAKAHKDEVNSITWLPHKMEFVSCSSDYYMKHWDSANGKLISQTSTRESVQSVHSDGKLIICGGELGTLRLFKLQQQQPQMVETIQHSLKLSSADSISKVAITNNAKVLAVGTKQYTNNVHIFKLKHEMKTHRAPRHHKTRSLPLHNNNIIVDINNITDNDKNAVKSDKNEKDAHAKRYSFGSSAFAKLTQSASNLFSFGQK